MIYLGFPAFGKSVSDRMSYRQGYFGGLARLRTRSLMFGNVRLINERLILPSGLGLGAYHDNLPGRLGFAGETRGQQSHEYKFYVSAAIMWSKSPAARGFVDWRTVYGFSCGFRYCCYRRLL